MWLLLVTLAAGIGSGYWATNRHERGRVLAAGLVMGASIMMTAASVGLLLDVHPLGLADRGVMSIFATSFLLGVTFIIGVWFVSARIDSQPHIRRGPSH